MGEIVIKKIDCQGDKLLKLYLTVLKSCTQKLFKMLSEDTHKTANIANTLKKIKQMKEFRIFKRAQPLL